ncbi:putative glycosyl transferase family 2 protein [Selenomonas ruminantium subsp. lactilytica TAM6421]|uniref:Putative glycosyl transferase family 2 protein n=1 Tax=Selenomonas ruminantium subsp. lactilytica (strain NBRC 103574 / TAM6421) TaxID=927704 RepID=I0GNE8_SELRL|nr:glycosyltransferase family 2 protein [Selenomonas ruminantium]BAL82285.1 putative glycosyl transferase family 2 protein [Selenomonas ruminantium subsp. lactilytica TAM6421]
MLVSIIMPTYNCGSFIGKSIESVLKQTLKDWELLIVDDCSTDNTEAVVREYAIQHKQIHYIRLTCNSGVANARTEGIRKARGQYVAFLDSDDIWLPQKLEKQIKFMQDNKISFSCTGYECMNELGESLHYAFIPPKEITYEKCILLSNPIGNLTVIYNQNILGKFEVPSIRKRNDFALWLQILKKTDKCYGMQDILGVYRMGRRGSISYNKLSQLRYHWKLYHDIEKHSMVRSALEILCWILVKGTKFGLKK